MSETSFSALMPSVLRLIDGEHGGCVHMVAPESAPLAEWGRCFATEDEVDGVLRCLEPLLVPLSVAGYGVPEVVLAAKGVGQADRVSVSLPALELTRGAAQSWEAAVPSALVGLRVCPTSAKPLDLGIELAAFKPGFGPKACGWLLLPVSEADPVTSLDDVVQKLWPALSRKVASASGDIGVAALVDMAGAHQTVSLVPIGASLPELVARARSKMQADGALGVLEAEFAANHGGPTLSEQMVALAGGSADLLLRVACKGVVATTAEVLWDRWNDSEPEEEAQDTPSTSDVDGLGWIRALLSFVGTTEVVDTGKVVISTMPLARLMEYRRNPAAAKTVDWKELPFIRPKAGSVDFTIPGDVTFTVAAQWDGQSKKFKRATSTRKLTHTLDFGQTRFEMEHAARDLAGWENEEGDAKKLGTVYLLPDKSFKGVDIFPAYLPGVGDAGIDASAVKTSLGSGDSSERRFWCSGLTMWTLAAAGYDVLSQVPGSNGLEFAYRELYKGKDTWRELDLYMLLNPQPEAVLAAGLILEESRGPVDARTGWTSWPALASIPASVVDFIDSKMGPVENVANDHRRAENGSKVVTLTKNNLGFFSGFPRESFYDTRSELDGRNFDDNPAVMGAPGALMALGLGHRVAYQQIRPGDIGQRFATKRSGSGHSFQVWAVKVAVTAPLGAGIENVAPAGTSDQGEPLYILTKDSTSPGIQIARTVAYQVLESNIPNSALGLDNNGGVSISDWATIPAEPAQNAVEGKSSKNRFYFARLHENPWSDANLGRATPAPPAADPPAEPGDGPPDTADDFDQAAARAHVEAVTAAYRNIQVAGQTITTRYRNTFLTDHGGPYVAANYGGQTEADAFKQNFDAYLAAMGKGSAAGVQKGMKESFDAGRIHSHPEVDKKAGEALTADDLSKYCHGLYGVDCIGFVLQILLSFDHYAAYMPPHITAAHKPPLSEKQSLYFRLTETNTGHFEAASTELSDPLKWRAMDVITWGGSGATGHVILIRSARKLSSGVWEVLCAESVGGDLAVNGPKTSTYFYAETADAEGLHWSRSEADAKAGKMIGGIPARARVRRATLGGAP